METSIPSCTEKAHRLEEFQNAAEVYLQRVEELQRKTATSSKPEYEELVKGVEAARSESERIRLALEQHIAEHGC